MHRAHKPLGTIEFFNLLIVVAQNGEGDSIGNIDDLGRPGMNKGGKNEGEDEKNPNRKHCTDVAHKNLPREQPKRGTYWTD